MMSCGLSPTMLVTWEVKSVSEVWKRCTMARSRPFFFTVA